MNAAGNRGWNPLLNVDPPLMKDFIYEVDGNFIYETDHLGRVKKATVNNIDLGLDYIGRRKQSYQSRAKEVKDGKLSPPVDDGGHIIKAGWGGPAEQINYFPQNAVENQQGAWKNMEDEITDLVSQGNSVKFEVEPVFSPSGDSKRPIGFDVKVTVNNQLDNELSTIYANPW